MRSKQTFRRILLVVPANFAREKGIGEYLEQRLVSRNYVIILQTRFLQVSAAMRIWDSEFNQPVD